tara:strand:+ start:217 stop:561 length:345 start_codon:yes stop_codon:yes gene_type:complete
LIRAVGNKRLDLSSSEYEYYCTLKDQFGESEFVGLFQTDKNGIIISVNPPINKNISFGVLFFLLNIMMNQRVRVLDSKINKVTDLEIKVDNFLEVNNIVERLENLEKQNLKEET